MMLGSAIIEPLPSENLKSYFNHSLEKIKTPVVYKKEVEFGFWI